MNKSRILERNVNCKKELIIKYIEIKYKRSLSFINCQNRNGKISSKNYKY